MISKTQTQIHSMTIRLLIFLVCLVWLGAGKTAAQETTPTLATAIEQRATESDAAESKEGDGLRFNFRGVPLDTVLEYLSRAAGYVIVREADVQGRLDVVSHEPLSNEEAINLLNSVLNKKGYAAVQNGRVLTIVTNEEARKRDIPVQMSRNPQDVPKNDEMVTQIIPVTRASVAQLIQNLEPLLPSYAVISANESSSAIILTATQTDIRRMMEIIQALDTTMSAVSTLRVFKLQYADATEVARMISDLFRAQNTAGQSSGGGRRGGMPPFMMFGGQGGEGGNRQSGGTQSIVQVVAVADTRTNSVVVSAPAEAMDALEGLIAQVDNVETEVTEIRVFPLQYADASTMAETIKSVFSDTQQASSSSNRGGGRSSFFQRFMPPGMDPGSQQGSSQTGGGGRTTAKVSAVADTRTNSVVVNAEGTVMQQIAQMVKELDSNPAKERKVFVYPLNYADPEETAQILEQMFGGTTNNRATTRRNTNNRNTGNSARSNTSSNQRRSSGNSGSNVPGGLGSGMSFGN